MPYKSDNYWDVIGKLGEKVESKDVCFKSAFFYRFQEVNKNTIDKFPMLRYTKRNPTEDIGIAFSKCFMNTKRCRFPWNHRCISFRNQIPKPESVVLLLESEILIHHYRKKCRMGKRCATENSTMFTDPSPFSDKYSAILEKRTLRIFQSLQNVN